MLHYFVAVWLVLASFVWADVFKGTVGKYPILMLIDDTNPDAQRYSYQGKLLSIPLYGKALCEPRPNQADDEEPEMLACFDLVRQGDILKGTWETIDHARSLPVHLTRLKLPKKTNKYGEPYRDEAFYTDHIRAQIRFKPLRKTGRQKGVRTTQYTEPTTRVVRSRIALPDPKATATINATLERIHRDDVMASIDCMDQGYVHKGFGVGKSSMQEGGDLVVEYYRDPFLLLSYGGSVDCGGAHPSNYYDHYLFNTHTGQNIDLNEAFDLYRDAEHTALRPAFGALLTRYQSPNSNLDEGQSCYDPKTSDYSVELYPATHNRIAVYLVGMGHAAFVCETAPIALIPVKALRPLARPKAIHYFPH
jgi:hypothetical protein